MRRKIDGPRRATRWIGEALVLDGDLTKGAPAVWRPPKSEPRCARVHHEDVSRDWEFGVDEAEVHLAASLLAGPAIVPRFATYADDEIETVIVVEEDIAGVSLRELVDALAKAGGEVPVGLVAYVGREIARALTTAGDVRVQLNPRGVDVGWDGRVWLRPLIDAGDIEDLVYGDDAVENVAYRVDDWKILDADLLGRDTAGYETVGLDDVLDDPVVRRGYARSLEPSVPPIDPFDDE
jgi:hypothetical protein